MLMWRITRQPPLPPAHAMSKSIVFVRHGLSKMNVALGRQPWGSPNFVDPDIRDAPLEPSGLAGARCANRSRETPPTSSSSSPRR